MLTGKSAKTKRTESGSVAGLLANVTVDPGAGGVAFRVLDLLRDLIISVQLRPGQRLSELEIASALGISKTPVREAMIRLDEMDLVRIVPQSGTYVTLISVQRYTTACFIRLHLEVGAARMAAVSPDPRYSFDKLNHIHEQLIDAETRDDHAEFVSLDEAFHREIFLLAGHLDAWTTGRRAQFDLNRARNIRRQHRIPRGPEVIRQHAEIIAALEVRDPDRAEAAIHAHIGDLERQVGRLFTDERLNGLIELPKPN